MPEHKFKAHGYVGLAVIIAAEVLLFTGQSFVGHWFTPIVWTGYLLFVDAAPIGVVEAKKEGDTLTGVELQTTKYSEGVPVNLTAPRRPEAFESPEPGSQPRSSAPAHPS